MGRRKHTYLAGDQVDVGLGLAVQLVECALKVVDHLAHVSLAAFQLCQSAGVNGIAATLLWPVLAVKFSRSAVLVDLE